ncbi:hypothetical protein P280DRAFT_83963 [Massarina eburnea CBS 473.64]|uniref:Uncharacterized protein n=1 Tax=Massarina eburnea CBS 473.64 TaxID=1395130 RepID=A0A6A6RWS3_9PLEO|nr:hypothetical protein P280DRAFT_83963 [Massarina eburnea CBS 473.64]
MDAEDIFAVFILGAMLLLPAATGIAVTVCVAYSRTKKWDKERTLAAANLESSSSLLPNSSSGEDDESDFLDTDDETEFHERKTEEAADRYKTFGQMWRKNFKRVWSGKGAKNLAKEREREERRKLAKAVARELERRERRRMRKELRASKEVEAEGELPPYKK